MLSRRKFLGGLAGAATVPVLAPLIGQLPIAPLAMNMTATEVRAREAAAIAAMMKQLEGVDIIDCINWKAVAEELERCR